MGIHNTLVMCVCVLVNIALSLPLTLHTSTVHPHSASLDNQTICLWESRSPGPFTSTNYMPDVYNMYITTHNAIFTLIKI